MTEYKAPLRDMHFVLHELAGLAEIARLPGFEEINAELVDQILEESAKFASGVLSPLNKPADEEGSKWDHGKVTTPKGFKEAYRQFVEAGWNALQAPSEHGGQGLPKVVSTPVVEMWKSANLSFSLVTMLTAGAVEALILRGTEQQKTQYLPQMIAGGWTGTMNLTEPQAGSDLALVRTKAVREGDHYRVSGQKIFITYGEHDLAENIIHLVLGRVEGAPEGVRGISLFLVPKFLVNADGSLGQRNEVQCASIEHKLGIHASPTAVLVYENAVGYLVGEENRGLEYMFIMMNLARFAVGMEGLAISERAYQQALAYAKERVQSRDVAGGGKAVTIIHHPDVRRMLMSMKSQTEAMRALGYVVAAAVDKSLRHPDKDERARSQAFVDLMIPIVKGWFTETGIELASTGIQANDLIGRKIAREGGATAKEVITVMRAVEAELGKAAGEDMAATREAFSAALTAAEECVSWMVITYGSDIKAAHAGAVPFLKLMGIVCGGWQMARAALVARQRLSEGKGDKSFYEAKIKTARFYADHVLTQAPGLRNAIVHGAAGVMALGEDQF